MFAIYLRQMGSLKICLVLSHDYLQLLMDVAYLSDDTKSICLIWLTFKLLGINLHIHSGLDSPKRFNGVNLIYIYVVNYLVEIHIYCLRFR